MILNKWFFYCDKAVRIDIQIVKGNFMDISNLTNREVKVLEYLVLGYSNAEIGKNLCISSHTAKAYVQSIINKLHANGRTHVSYIAAKSGIV